MKENTIKKEWSFDFDYSASLGAVYTKFMEGLKEKKFLGNKCGGRTFFPPRPFCYRTLELTSEWLEGDGVGTLEAFTVCYQETNSVAYPRSEMKPRVPYVLGVIRVHDSDQCFFHILSGVDAQDPAALLEKIKAGLKVRPVWAKERIGNILDIESFELVE